ncbi:glutathione peroxidase [Pyruvatibacter sp.]|uniref:glutathione peroxidase n=1 Tax=Pyruvatibacter sp. TaxID=1981328 RepID=UPI0032EC52E6
MSAHDFSFSAITGGDINLADFKGQTLLVVNTASECGFTPQYGDLQRLAERYKDRGLVVLGVPSNDFGAQEPGTEAEIHDFCTATYSVDFPMTAKQKVIGGDAHPFYKWAAAEGGDEAVPGWNFHKLLVGPDGSFIKSFGPKVTPMSDDLLRDLRLVLDDA